MQEKISVRVCKRTDAQVFKNKQIERRDNLDILQIIW